MLHLCLMVLLVSFKILKHIERSNKVTNYSSRCLSLIIWTSLGCTKWMPYTDTSSVLRYRRIQSIVDYLFHLQLKMNSYDNVGHISTIPAASYWHLIANKSSKLSIMAVYNKLSKQITNFIENGSFIYLLKFEGNTINKIL